MEGENDPTEMDIGNESEEEKKSGDKKGRRKIKIELIEDKSRRHITFSKRKLGIMKKAWELATLTGTQVLLLVASETGHVYTFATPKLQPLITKPEGKNLIQACLNAPDTVTVQPTMVTPRQGGRYEAPMGEFVPQEEDKSGRVYPGLARPPAGMAYPQGYQNIPASYGNLKGPQYFPPSGPPAPGQQPPEGEGQ